MKAILEPVLEKHGWCLLTYATDEFQELLSQAQTVIEPLVKETPSDCTVYYKVKGDDLGEFDTCDNEKCIKSAKAQIREIYGKYTRVEEEWTGNDGDHEGIERCSQCGKPLNEFLTWCDSELEYLEQNYPLCREFIKNEAFVINAILQSSPTSDASLHRHSYYSQSKVEQKDLDKREAFFQRIVTLAGSVLATAGEQVTKEL